MFANKQVFLVQKHHLHHLFLTLFGPFFFCFFTLFAAKTLFLAPVDDIFPGSIWRTFCKIVSGKKIVRKGGGDLGYPFMGKIRQTLFDRLHNTYLKFVNLIPKKIILEWAYIRGKTVCKAFFYVPFIKFYTLLWYYTTRNCDGCDKYQVWRLSMSPATLFHWASV